MDPNPNNIIVEQHQPSCCNQQVLFKALQGLPQTLEITTHTILITKITLGLIHLKLLYNMLISLHAHLTGGKVTYFAT